MTRPRSQIVSLETTPYYHCMARCVRRAFLCGQDSYSGKSFDHRKPWLVERLALLAQVFAIDIAAYAIMNNHYHLVVHINPERAKSWSTDEVIRRWTSLFRGPLLVQRFKAGWPLTESELLEIQKLVEEIRQKLCSISKFMGCLNEYMARKANEEDGCTGRFWEGRFKSQALLDVAALVSCMAYVDLNPIRAGIAVDLPDSDFTSIKLRLHQVDAYKNKQALKRLAKNTPPLMPFEEAQTNNISKKTIPFNLHDYLELVDWTGRSIRSDKKGHISDITPNVLVSMGLTQEHWQVLALDIQKQAICMLNGLETIMKIEQLASKNKAA